MARDLLTAAVLAADGGGGRRIAAALEAGGVDVSQCARGADELEALSGSEPDVVVLSCASGVKRAVLELERRLPRVPAVAVVGSSRAVREALEANAKGVVFDARVEAALVPAVRAVGAGQIVLPQSEYRQARPVVLSHRERQVLRLAVDGMTNDSIARMLYISRSTVKSHLTAAFAKLSVSSRSEAAVVLSNPDEPATRLVFNGGWGAAEPAAAGRQG
jgi:DNA-binding NarL/FixJ family response regulator